jgi:hypothetical protein
VVDSLGNAATYDGEGWSPVHDVDDHFGPLAAISCPTPTFCATVGGGRAVTRTVHGWGPLRVLPVRRLHAVSCASRAFCLAVSKNGFAIRYDARWAGRRIPAPDHLVELSCSSRTFCLALTETGDAYRYDGNVWRPAGAIPAGANEMSVACASSSFCMAATGTGLLARYHGGMRWTTHRIAQGFVPNVISCSGSSFCLAVATPGGVAARYNGSWHRPAVFHDYGEGRTPQTADRVSCAAAGRCLVVDEIGNSFELRGGWHDVAPYPGDRTAAPVVSCSGAPRFCLVTDGFGHVWRRADGVWERLALPIGQVSDPHAGLACRQGSCHLIDSRSRAWSWDGQAWSGPSRLPDGRWTNLACATADRCVAVEATGEGASRVQVLTRDTWSDGGVVALGQVAALDCARNQECWAGGATGTVSHWAPGEGWTEPLTIVAATDGDGLNPLSSMSCPAAYYCAVHDSYGATYVQAFSVWSAALPSPDLGPINCPSPGACWGVVADTPGPVRRFNGSQWGAGGRFTPHGYVGTVTSLDCATPTYCLAVDSNGNAFVRR